MAKQLEELSIKPAANGGHTIRHEFKREPAKGSKGDIYIDRPASEEHSFGPGAEQEQAVVSHITKALGFSGKKAAPAEKGTY